MFHQHAINSLILNEFLNFLEKNSFFSHNNALLIFTKTVLRYCRHLRTNCLYRKNWKNCSRSGSK